MPGQTSKLPADGTGLSPEELELPAGTRWQAGTFLPGSPLQGTGLRHGPNLCPRAAGVRASSTVQGPETADSALQARSHRRTHRHRPRLVAAGRLSAQSGLPLHTEEGHRLQSMSLTRVWVTLPSPRPQEEQGWPEVDQCPDF